ncbi:MAG: outer-membrane lipoprotein carrier protein LolA [Rickettsiaceae bacterium]|nr:outer-membrane lipoprotein carrier protein LolA [Rickettsiaceae bacterium]
MSIETSMKYSNKNLLSFSIALMIFCSFCFSSANCAKPKEQTIINKIQEYLGSLNRVGINFTQRDSTGTIHQGILLIQKPNLFRANYDAPHPILIVGTKNFISIYDYELNEASRIDPKDNIFKFLLDEDITISSKLDIISIKENTKDVTLVLNHKDTEQKARISFSLNPITIAFLEVPDDGENFTKGVTRVVFDRPRQITGDTKSLFTIKNPEVYGAPPRLSREKISKIIYKK